ncbi:hypothetical protein CPC08DRAFT_753556 [Agrocybe pediades]|nr:hypothetical protein CPC08DRAFT_753556 [Agrocybe pediades]
MPGIWSRLVSITSSKPYGLTSLDCLFEIVMRSGRAPLWIEATTTWMDHVEYQAQQNIKAEDRSRHFLTQLLHHDWERLESLSLEFNATQYSLLEFVPRMEASRLKALKLRGVDGDTQLAKFLLRSSHATVQLLDIHSFHYPLDSCSFSRLRYLRTTGDVPCWSTVSDTLSALRTMPMLKGVCLEHRMESVLWDTADPSSSTTIQLTELEYFYVSSSASNCHMFGTAIINSSSTGCLFNFSASLADHPGSHAFPMCLEFFTQTLRNNIRIRSTRKDHLVSQVNINVGRTALHYSEGSGILNVPWLDERPVFLGVGRKAVAIVRPFGSPGVLKDQFPKRRKCIIHEQGTLFQ